MVMTTVGGGGGWKRPWQCWFVPLLILFALCETSLPPPAVLPPPGSLPQLPRAAPLLCSCCPVFEGLIWEAIRYQGRQLGTEGLV